MCVSQGCIHGSLVVNKVTLMFTPNNQDPLVKEHGIAKFEIIIPIEDISYAAITHSVTPPNRYPPSLSHTHTHTHTTPVSYTHLTLPTILRV